MTQGAMSSMEISHTCCSVGVVHCAVGPQLDGRGVCSPSLSIALVCQVIVALRLLRLSLQQRVKSHESAGQSSSLPPPFSSFPPAASPAEALLQPQAPETSSLLEPSTTLSIAPKTSPLLDPFAHPIQATSGIRTADPHPHSFTVPSASPAKKPRSFNVTMNFLNSAS